MTSTDVQFKEFSFTKQKTGPRTAYDEIENHFLKKTENQCQNATCEQKDH